MCLQYGNDMCLPLLNTLLNTLLRCFMTYLVGVPFIGCMEACAFGIGTCMHQAPHATLLSGYCTLQHAINHQFEPHTDHVVGAGLFPYCPYVPIVACPTSMQLMVTTMATVSMHVCML
jgi:hypothetical protein